MWVLFSLWLDLVVPREKENEQDLSYPIFLPRKYDQAYTKLRICNNSFWVFWY